MGCMSTFNINIRIYYNLCMTSTAITDYMVTQLMLIFESYTSQLSRCLVCHKKNMKSCHVFNIQILKLSENEFFSRKHIKFLSYFITIYYFDVHHFYGVACFWIFSTVNFSDSGQLSCVLHKSTWFSALTQMSYKSKFEMPVLVVSKKN